MDFQKEYQQKLVSADEAVKIIKSGDWVIMVGVPALRMLWIKHSQNVPTN